LVLLFLFEILWVRIWRDLRRGVWELGGRLGCNLLFLLVQVLVGAGIGGIGIEVESGGRRCLLDLLVCRLTL
jgi:hypothetical protein